MLLIAAEASDFTEEVFATLSSWSSLGLLEPFIFNDSEENGADLRSRKMFKGVVNEAPLDHLLENFLGDLTLHWLTVSMTDRATTQLSGRTAAAQLLYATSQMVSSWKDLSRLRILASDRPATTLDDTPEEGWPFRVFLVPEDRDRPDALSNLVPERFSAHVAAGLASLGGLWPSPPLTTMPDVTEAITSDQQGNEPSQVWLVRQFARIVELPSMFNELLHGAALDDGSYPNPDQEKFERVDLSDRVATFAKSFVDNHSELRPIDPKLVRDEPKNKVSLRSAIRKFLSYMAARIVLRPTELLDDVLGQIYDRTATLVESAFPGNAVSIERWAEIGQVPSVSERAVQDLVQSNDRLIEESLGHVWEEYWRLCTGLVDGGDGVDVLGEQLFLTTKDRRQISKSPSDVVPDPVGTSTDTSTATRAGPVDVPTRADSTLDAGLATASEQVHDVVLSPRDETAAINPTSATSPAAEDMNETGRSGVDADLSFTGQVRTLIEASLKHVSQELTDIERVRVESETAEPDENTSTKKPGFFARLRRGHHHRASAPGEINRATSRRIRRTLVLGFLATLVGFSLLVWRHQPVWAIVWLLACMVVTMVKAVINAFVGWRRERRAAQQEKDLRIAAINKVISEATVRSNVRGLSRRLDEVTDWNQIIGLIIHHPWRFSGQLQTEPPSVAWRLPLSVVRAEGVLEGTKVEALQHQFNHFLFQRGWLSARVRELESRVQEEIAEVVGQPESQLLQPIESDTSLDPDSPRRRFLTMVRTTLLSEGGDPDLRAKVNEFLADNHPLGTLITEVREYQPTQDVLKTDRVSIDDYFSPLRQTGDGFLVAHWLDGRMENESRVTASIIIGDEHDATVLVRTEPESGHVLPARILCLSIQRSERLATDNLRAFQRP